MSSLLFVTAPEADHKAINLLLLYLRDWEYGSGDSFRLATTRNAYDYDVPPTRLPSGDMHRGETSPPLDSGTDNTWAGATLEDVEGFCLDLQSSMEKSDNKPSINSGLFIVVDSEGLEAGECVICEQACVDDYEAEEIEWLDQFRKMRVPWEDLHAIWCNLDIANMDWLEFTQDQDEEKQVGRHSSPDDFWYTYRAISEEGDLSEKNRKRREDEIQRLREAGHI